MKNIKKKYDTKKLVLIGVTIFFWAYYLFKAHERIEFWKFLIFYMIIMFGVFTTDMDEVKKGVSKNMPKNLK